MFSSIDQSTENLEFSENTFIKILVISLHKAESEKVFTTEFSCIHLDHVFQSLK